MSCISPTAPFDETTWGENPDSAAMILFTNADEIWCLCAAAWITSYREGLGGWTLSRARGTSRTSVLRIRRLTPHDMQASKMAANITIIIGLLQVIKSRD